MENIEKFKRYLSTPIDGHVLGLFRLIFGSFMAYEAVVYYRMGLIENGLLAPHILFKFDGFGWIHPFSQPVMVGILAFMGVSAAFMAAGLLFRWACWGFALSYAFFFLQEKSYYNNHIYMFILMGVLISFTNADQFLSLRSHNSPYNSVPRWQQWILGAWVMIVYFYGGLTKFKFDWWYNKEPVTSLVYKLPDTHIMAPLLKNAVAIDVLTYGGLLIDILAPLLLWYKPIRRWALIPFLVFHGSNSQIFDDIGIFPFVMLSALVLYFETEEIPGFRKLAAKNTGEKKFPVTPAFTRNFLIGFFAFQLLFPFRGLFLPNSRDWTGIARNFSWRMKVDTRTMEEMEFTVENPANGQVSRVDVRSFINDTQVLNMIMDVRAVAAFARKVRETVAERGMPNAIVRARIRVRYNGRPPQFFVRPDVDLASVEYSPFKKLDWVVPQEDN